MKMIMYTMVDSDGLCGLPFCASSEYYVAKAIQGFYKKVGEYQPVTWKILGSYDMDTMKLESDIRDFDWNKVLSEKEIKVDTDALETSSLAREAENE